MKTKILGLVTVFVLAAVMVFGQTQSQSIEVKGNGEACKERIEEAATSVEGVSNATWDVETNMLTVDFDETQTSLDEVEQAIAAVGHDTPNYKADDEVYDQLPEESKYREETPDSDEMDEE